MCDVRKHQLAEECSTEILHKWGKQVPLGHRCLLVVKAEMTSMKSLCALKYHNYV